MNTMVFTAVFTAAAFAAALVLTPLQPASAQLFAGIGAGLGSAVGHGEEESSIADSSQRKDAVLSDRKISERDSSRHRKAHNGCKTPLHQAEPAHTAHIND